MKYARRTTVFDGSGGLFAVAREKVCKRVHAASTENTEENLNIYAFSEKIKNQMLR